MVSSNCNLQAIDILKWCKLAIYSASMFDVETSSSGAMVRVHCVNEFRIKSSTVHSSVVVNMSGWALSAVLMNSQNSEVCAHTHTPVPGFFACKAGFHGHYEDEHLSHFPQVSARVTVTPLKTGSKLILTLCHWKETFAWKVMQENILKHIIWIQMLQHFKESLQNIKALIKFLSSFTVTNIGLYLQAMNHIYSRVYN